MVPEVNSVLEPVGKSVTLVDGRGGEIKKELARRLAPCV
jgi:hypothetical protein